LVVGGSRICYMHSYMDSYMDSYMQDVDSQNAVCSCPELSNGLRVSRSAPAGRPSDTC
jgi:hypothetical protein